MVAELDYMIGRDYGEGVRLAFLDEVERGAYRLEAFGAADFSRARELTGAHPHLAGFGIADASNVVPTDRGSAEQSTDDLSFVSDVYSYVPAAHHMARTMLKNDFADTGLTVRAAKL